MHKALSGLIVLVCGLITSANGMRVLYSEFPSIAGLPLIVGGMMMGAGIAIIYFGIVEQQEAEKKRLKEKRDNHGSGIRP